jgi:hypothetical protein
MAYTVHEGFPGIGFWDWYNVSQTVGAGGINLIDDVCLVQILLAYLRPYVHVLQDFSLRPLAVDGICGPITASYIEAFQSHVRVTRPFFHPDGIVEPGHRSQVNSPQQARGATIVELNFELHDRAPEAHRDIRTSAFTPGVLRMALSRVA